MEKRDLYFNYKMLCYNPCTMFFTKHRQLRQMATITAVLEANVKRMNDYKRRLIDKELKKPFFEKLYGLYEKG